MRFKYLIPILFLPVLACSRQPSASTLQWAQFPVAANYGSITGRLLIAQSQNERNFEKVRVCLQGSGSYQGPALQTEVKLAFATWLAGFGDKAERAWNQLEFVEQDRCPETDPQFGAVVAIASFEKPAPAEAAQVFEPMSCIPFVPDPRLLRFPNYNCNTYGQVLGLAGPGGMARGRGIFRSVAPTVASLSPYTEWVSLEKELSLALTLAKADARELQKARMEGWANDETLTSSTLEQLLSSYQGLIKHADTLSFRELSAFAQLLSQSSYATSSILRFVADPFQPGQYRPQRSAFHTLLHEVGHQFGMAHAHEPSSDEITGPSSLAQEKEGRWVSELATMAYGRLYTYLTEDDKAGITQLVKLESQLILGTSEDGTVQ